MGSESEDWSEELVEGLEELFTIAAAKSSNIVLYMNFVELGFLLFALKWSLFGTCLFGLYLFELRKRRATQRVEHIDFQSRGRAACRFGLFLASFAFLLSPSIQWIYVAGGLIAGGGIVGWWLAHHLAAHFKAQGLLEQTTLRQTGWLGSFAFAVLVMLVIGGMLVRLNSVELIMLLWGMGAGLLVAWGLCSPFESDPGERHQRCTS